MTNFDVDAATILRVRHGSHAYGTNIEGSDLDLRGVCIEPVDHQLGFLHQFEQRVRHDPDETIFSLKKFVKLASDCNPNVLEVLFVRPEDVLECKATGRMLLDARDLFITRRARYTFSGAAHAQLKRIQSHRSWLLDPPKACPDRADFGLTSARAISESEFGAFEAMKLPLELPDGVLHLYILERQYRAAKRHWDQYQGWLKHRNPARAALEAVAGYDPKHGMHLIRWMRMACEVLDGESVNVWREDAKELKSIRTGAWSYERLMEEAERLERRASALYHDSKLPREPDRKAMDRLVVALTRDFYGE